MTLTNDWMSERTYQCIYFSALLDLKSLFAFSNCILTGGGDKCVKAIKAGSNCFEYAGSFLVESYNQYLSQIKSGNPKR